MVSYAMQTPPVCSNTYTINCQQGQCSMVCAIDTNATAAATTPAPDLRNITEKTIIIFQENWNATLSVSNNDNNDIKFF